MAKDPTIIFYGVPLDIDLTLLLYSLDVYPINKAEYMIYGFQYLNDNKIYLN